VRKIDANIWECTACGARVTVPGGARPIALLLTLPGRPRERVVTVRDEIVHRCIFGDGPDDSG
jgi:ribosomal protein L37AE/L43A